MMYVTYIINPALIVNEVWGPYLILYIVLCAGAYFTLLLILLGLASEFLRRRCPPYLVLLKTLMKLYSTILFIPCFSTVSFHTPGSAVRQRLPLHPLVRSAIMEGVPQHDVLPGDARHRGSLGQRGGRCPGGHRVAPRHHLL